MNVTTNTDFLQANLITEKNDSYIGRYCLILPSIDLEGARYDAGDVVQIISINDLDGFNVKTIRTTNPRGNLNNGSNPLLFNYYVPKNALRLLDIIKKETKIMSKTRLKAAEKIAGVDSKFIGQRVAIALKGTFNDLEFNGNEEGIITEANLTQYATEGGSFRVTFDKNDVNGYKSAYISPKYLKLLDTAAIKALAGPKKRLSKKERELAGKPVLEASKEYVRIVSAQLGIDVSTIPSATYLEMVTISDKTEINQILLKWNGKPKPKPEIPEALQTALKDLVPRQQRDYIARIQANINSCRNNATNYFIEANAALARLMEENRKLNAAKGTGAGATNMLTHVQEIIKSGWWTFDEKKSKITSGSDCELVFFTKDINVRHVHTDMGVNINVDLGQFSVKYQVYNGNVVVDCRDNNTIYSGCSHPHFSGQANGAICWGNAVETYKQAMESGNPVRIFETLQSLIQNYGESPFADINGFVRIQEELKRPYTDNTGGDYKLYNNGDTVYRIKNFAVPKHFKDSPDIVERNETSGYTKMRFWKLSTTSTDVFIRSKENSKILYKFNALINEAAGGITSTSRF